MFYLSQTFIVKFLIKLSAYGTFVVDRTDVTVYLVMPNLKNFAF